VFTECFAFAASILEEILRKAGSRLLFQFGQNRAMVGMPRFGQNHRAFQSGFQRLADQNVIDAPAFVVRARVAEIAPPRVMVRVFVEMAEAVDESFVDENVEPVALVRQKSGDVLVAFGIVDVDFLVADVVIAANDEVRELGAQFVNVGVEIIHVHEFVRNPDGVRSAWHVKTHDGNVAKISADVAAFEIHVFDTGSEDDVIGLGLAQNRDAAVAFFVCGIPVMIRISGRFKVGDGNLILRRFDFLEANHIRVGHFEPIDKSFGNCCSDTVDIIGNYSHLDCKNLVFKSSKKVQSIIHKSIAN